MFCAECGSEYREGIRLCPECGGELVAAPLSEVAGAHSMDYAPVLETSDVALLPVVQSVLEGAGIPFEVEGAETLGILPVGVFGTGEKMHGVSARVLVPAARAEEARELLAGIGEPAMGESDEDE